MGQESNGIILFEPQTKMQGIQKEQLFHDKNPFKKSHFRPEFKMHLKHRQFIAR
jgi:hypothetical protein